MKRSNFIKDCGPFEVHSISQDGRGVRLEIYPAFPQYDLSDKDMADDSIEESWKKESHWAIHRYRGEGGGPNIFVCLALAKEFEKWLNQFYLEEQVSNWKSTNDLALKAVRVADQKAFEKAMARNCK